MTFVHPFVAVFPRQGLWLSFALILVLGAAPSGRAQPVPYPSVNRPDSPARPATQVQLDLVVVQLRHDLYLRLMEFVGNTPSSEKNQPQPLFRICKSPRELGVFLEVLDHEGLLKVLAEPRLVTLSGRAASFCLGGGPAGAAGTEEPIVPSPASGTWLEVVPTVMPGGKIQLDLTHEVREAIPPSDAATQTGNPGRDIDKLKTTVLLKPGQTFLVGGIVRRVQTETVTSVPVLGQLPFVGSIFRTKKCSPIEVHQVVLVSPRLFPAAEQTHRLGAAERLRQLERRLKKMQQEIEKTRTNIQESASARKPL